MNDHETRCSGQILFGQDIWAQKMITEIHITETTDAFVSCILPVCNKILNLI